MRLQPLLVNRSTLWLGLVPVLLLAGTWFAAKSAMDHLLYHDAVLTAQYWTSYLADNVKDLEDIAKGAQPTNDSQAFFDRAEKAGQVFRYVIYDPQGHTRFVSDTLKKEDEDGRVLPPPSNDAIGLRAGPKDDDDDDESLAEHNPAAARAIASGKALVNAEEGDKVSRPAFFSEAYLPVIAGGKKVAVVETYIDQTEKREEYRRTLIILAGALLLLVATAFALPSFAWLKRSDEKRIADAHIHFLAHHDSLTGLINRNRLNHEIETRLSKPLAAPFALHCIDVDHFKDVNDTLGHDGGDALIVSIADRLRELAGDGGVVSRIGGDEFVLLQDGHPGAAVDDSSAFAEAAEIGRRLALPYDVGGHVANVTVSVGVALAPSHGDTVARLMKSADLAAYASKAAGRDRASLFKSDMDREQAERLRLESAIRDAVLTNSFELHYQPAVKMPEARLVGFEALLRMRDKDGRQVSPAQFIPVAEQMGLIDKIGEWVLREACATASRWPPNLQIAVNLSPAQFARGNLVGLVATILGETGLDPRRLELEITEGLLLSKSADVMDKLRLLKALGVSIVMDDFGTGYSSLSYLWQFPFDKIKIDRAFMLALEAEERGNAETIVKTIIALGRALNVTVTVEGVETASQVAFVTAARCDQIQGFYFGKPMPGIELAAQIASDMMKEFPSQSRPGGGGRVQAG
jgi:diguanylate cyclase (GGDEF)-like protein